MSDLLQQPNTGVSIPGGVVFREQNIVLDPFVDASPRSFHASRMFMGTAAVSRHGLMQSDIILVQAERKLCQAFLEINMETLRILPVLESNDCVIGIPHDDHIAPCVARTPLFDPEIVNVMKVHIRKQWGCH